ncbi:MAG: hypothetical protein ABEJ25_08195 [Candidatus Bipolaricaulia bacterium]
MNREVIHKREFTDQATEKVENTGSSCPECGEELVATRRGVTSAFPSPALERKSCTNSSCNYFRYVKLNSDGFADRGASSPKRSTDCAATK